MIEIGIPIQVDRDKLKLIRVFPAENGGNPTTVRFVGETVVEVQIYTDLSKETING